MFYTQKCLQQIVSYSEWEDVIEKEDIVHQEANIHVYASENGVGKNSVYENDLYERALECLKKHLEAHKGKPFTEKMKTDYMNKVYNIEEIEGTQYFREIKEYLKLFKNIHPTEYPAKKQK